MNGAGHQFLPRARLAGNQNAGVGLGDFGNPGKHIFQGRGSSHDLFKHRRLVNLLTQRYILFLEPLLGALPIVDIGAGCIPSGDAPLLV